VSPFRGPDDPSVADQRHAERVARAAGWFDHLRNVLDGKEAPVADPDSYGSRLDRLTAQLPDYEEEDPAL
jgi:hypothetical protein